MDYATTLGCRLYNTGIGSRTRFTGDRSSYVTIQTTPRTRVSSFHGRHYLALASPAGNDRSRNDLDMNPSAPWIDVAATDTAGSRQIRSRRSLYDRTH